MKHYTIIASTEEDAVIPIAKKTPLLSLLQVERQDLTVETLPFALSTTPRTFVRILIPSYSTAKK